MKTVIVIDMQYDFISGALGTDEAKAIVPEVSDIVIKARNLGYQIIATQDTHTEHYLETLEGKLLPVPHCIKDTDGWKITNRRHLADELKNSAIFVWKPTFGCSQLPSMIHPKTEEIILIGVCTDICVITNALLLRTAFPDMPITIYENACAGTTPEAHTAALQTAKSCQINVTTWEGENL